MTMTMVMVMVMDVAVYVSRRFSVSASVLVSCIGSWVDPCKRVWTRSCTAVLWPQSQQSAQLAIVASVLGQQRSRVHLSIVYKSSFLFFWL